MTTSLTWIDVDGLAPADLQRQFHLPRPVAGLMAEGAARSTVDVADGVVFLALRTTTWVEGKPSARPGEVRLGEVRLAVTGSQVLHVAVATDCLDRVRAAPAEAARPAASGTALLLRVVDEVMHAYGQVLGELTDAVGDVEENLFRPAGPDVAERIYRLGRDVMVLRKAMAPLVSVLDRLADAEPEDVGGRRALRPDQRANQLEHLVDGTDALMTLLSTALQVNLTRVSIQQNDDMRRISAWGAIWAVPTLLAGIYGMNFRHMPELAWRFGYPLLIVIMAVESVVLYRVLRRVGWL